MTNRIELPESGSFDLSRDQDKLLLMTTLQKLNSALDQNIETLEQVVSAELPVVPRVYSGSIIGGPPVVNPLAAGNGFQECFLGFTGKGSGAPAGKITFVGSAGSAGIGVSAAVIAKQPAGESQSVITQWAAAANGFPIELRIFFAFTIPDGFIRWKPGPAIELGWGFKVRGTAAQPSFRYGIEIAPPGIPVAINPNVFFGALPDPEKVYSVDTMFTSTELGPGWTPGMSAVVSIRIQAQSWTTDMLLELGHFRLSWE